MAWAGPRRSRRFDAARDAFAQFERERAQTLSRLSAVEEALHAPGCTQRGGGTQGQRRGRAGTAWARRRRRAEPRERARARGARTDHLRRRARGGPIDRARTAARAARFVAIAAERSSWDERLAHPRRAIIPKQSSEKKRSGTGRCADAPTDSARRAPRALRRRRRSGNSRARTPPTLHADEAALADAAPRRPAGALERSSART